MSYSDLDSLYGDECGTVPSTISPISPLYSKDVWRYRFAAAGSAVPCCAIGRGRESQLRLTAPKLVLPSYYSNVMPSIHDTQSDSDDDNMSRTSDEPGDDGLKRTSHDNNQPQQSEADNLTSHSRRRRRKSRCKTMGIHRPEYVVKGSDPFDYEQKFPEDKRYEELGSMARVWRTYLEECGPFDLEMVEGWKDALDVLLVFAGLFSAVVTTFVAQTSQSLQVDYGQVTATLLIELIDVQRSVANGSLVNDIPRSDLTFRPSALDSWVNGLWFTSLSLSLSTALFAVLTKQWIHQYMSVPSGTPWDRCRLRQFRYMGLQRWDVDLIIGLLPVLMSASLAVFLVGLVLFIIPLRVSIASVVGSVTLIAFTAYLITNFLPILYPSCPYKTPLSQYIFPLYAYITHTISFKWIKLGDDTQSSPSNPASYHQGASPPSLSLSKMLKLQLSSSMPMKQMYTLCPGYIPCHPTPAYRVLSYSRQVLYRSLL
ncbi:hypothetical protein IW262DRAFT_1103165 [Armillaria fumosa]|nr:hypothetical protein IW262DRAFT_1103165 [Armillaria fumosa]